jgi:sugar-specific transcriptional regulator TrmB
MLNWKNLLKTLGFTDSEGRIYLTSLELGPSSVQDIAKKVEVSRMTTYTVIESLTEKGLMSSVQRGKKTFYMAEAPEKLVNFLQKRMQRMGETLKEVETAVKDLKLIQHGDKPLVKMFEGHEALKVIQEDLLDTSTTYIDEFVNVDDILNLYSFEDELTPFYSKLSKKNIKQRRSILLKKNVEKTFRDEKLEKVFLDKEKYNFHGGVIVYGKKVAFSTFKGKQISVLIESEELAKTIKAFFDFALKK